MALLPPTTVILVTNPPPKMLPECVVMVTGQALHQVVVRDTNWPNG